MHGMKRHNGRHQGGRGRFGGPGEGNGMFGGRRGGDGHAGGGGSGRHGKRFAGEELRLMVLGLLGEEPQHGYQLIRSFAAKSGDAYSPSPGMLYPLLTMLADMGLVTEVNGDAASARRRYALTAEGQAEVLSGREKLDAAFQRLSSMAEVAGRTDTGPVRRAMMNLRTAAVQRMGKDGASDQLAFDVAAVLDEAAQKIERL
jgi:DNA-binding PadR family transcriptional regulator